jgi:hypothetical protein
MAVANFMLITAEDYNINIICFILTCMKVNTSASGMFYPCVCYIQDDLFYLLLWSMKSITLGNYKKKKSNHRFFTQFIWRFVLMVLCMYVRFKKKPNWQKNMQSNTKSRTVEIALTIFFPRWKPKCAEWKWRKFRFKPSICLPRSYVRLVLPRGGVFLFQKLKMNIEPTPDRRFCF